MKSVFLLMLLLLFCSANADELLQGISKFTGASYWGGKTKIITVNGAEVLELTSTVDRNRYFGRAFASYSVKTKFAAGDRLVATAKVRGNGKFFIGILKYRKPGVMPITVFVEPIELTANAKELKFVFELDDAFANVLPFLQVQGEGTAYIESFKFEKSADKESKLSKVVPVVYPAANSKNKTAPSVIYSGIDKLCDQPYWGGKVAVVTVNGKKVLRLTSNVSRGRYFGRAFVNSPPKIAYKAKDKLVATAKVRGEGEFFIGILKYPKSGVMPATVFTEPIELTEKTKEVKFVFELDNSFWNILPFVQIQGESIVYLESFKFEKTADKNLKPSKIVPVRYPGPNGGKTNIKKKETTLLYSGLAFKDQPYWGGKANIKTIDGKKVLELSTSEKRGRKYGRAYASFSTRNFYFPETKIIATAKVRGIGKFSVGLLKYKNMKGTPIVENAAPVDLTETATEVVFDFKTEDLYEKILPTIQVDGPTCAYIESFKLERVIDNSARISEKTPMQVVAEKQKAEPIEFMTALKEKNLFVTVENNKKSVEKIKSDKNGKVVIPAAEYPRGISFIYLTSNGCGRMTYVNVINSNVHGATDAIARRIKLKKPIKMLVIGDSLSDYYRGYNYINRLNYWINKYNPGKFSFYNAGVSGDYVERTADRMEVELKYMKKNVHRQNMFKGIFKNEYDYVFIWLGQNDTRCMRHQGYKIPETTPEEQNKYLSLILKRLKEKCPKAKIVLIAPSPSDESVFANREKTWAKNRNIAYYGKVEFLNAYDAINREICKKHKLDYIDMLSVMRNYKPLKDIYVSDGVHLSEKGGILVADELLKYFAKEFK